MGEVVSIANRERVEYLNGKLISQPKTGVEYLFLCKDNLSTLDYEEILLCIMDREYYDDAEKQIRDIVDTYFTFNK